MLPGIMATGRRPYWYLTCQQANTSKMVIGAPVVLFLQLYDEHWLFLLTLIPHKPELLVHLEEVQIPALGIVKPVVCQAA